MSQEKFTQQLPAPCIVDTGIIVSKDDMRRLLGGLGIVRYVHILDGERQQESEGYVMEVFTHPHQSTLIANHALYLNVQSFDYLQISYSSPGESCFDLYQENRQLRLIPLSNPLQERHTEQMNNEDLEAMLTDVLSDKWDATIDEDDCPF